MAIGFDGGAADVDLATDTVYASSQETNIVSVLNGARCNASSYLRLHPVRADDDGRRSTHEASRRIRQRTPSTWRTEATARSR